MKWIYAALILSAGLVAGLLCGGGCGDSDAAALNGEEPRELVTVPISRLDAAAIINEGEHLVVQISGTLPDGCHEFNRVILRRSAESFELAAYASKPFFQCPQAQGAEFSQKITVVGLSVGVHKISALGNKGITVVVVPSIDTDTQCEETILQVKELSLPRTVPTPGEIQMSVVLELPSACQTADRMEVDFYGQLMELTAYGKRCGHTESECPQSSYETRFKFFIEDPPEGKFTAMSRGKLFGDIEFMQRQYCRIEPATVASVKLPDRIYAGEPFNVSLIVSANSEMNLGPLRSSVLYNSIEYYLSEFTCPANAVPVEEVEGIILQSRIEGLSDGSGRILVNGETKSQFSVLSQCNEINGQVNTVEATSDLTSSIQQGFPADTPINILIQGTLDESCQERLATDFSRRSNIIEVNPELRSCPALGCRADTRRYEEVVAIVNVGEGNYQLQVGDADPISIAVTD